LAIQYLPTLKVLKEMKIIEMIITQEKHRCDKLIPSIRLNTIEGYVPFSSNFEYKIDKQGDTNKLIGLSDSYFHHINSIRIGWRVVIKRK
jgi:hypothetical protein